MNFKCYFVITPKFFECLHFEIIKLVYSEPVATTKSFHISEFSSFQNRFFFFSFIFISSQGIITSVHFCGEESGSPPPPISIILTEIKEQSRDFFVDSLVKWGHFGYILSNGLLGVSFWSLSLSKHQLATSCLNCWGDGL